MLLKPAARIHVKGWLPGQTYRTAASLCVDCELCVNFWSLGQLVSSTKHTQATSTVACVH